MVVGDIKQRSVVFLNNTDTLECIFNVTQNQIHFLVSIHTHYSSILKLVFIQYNPRSLLYISDNGN